MLIRNNSVLFLRSWLKTDLIFLNLVYQLIYIEDGEIGDNPSPPPNITPPNKTWG
ncbi:MAG: hypothetical protein ACI849_001809 [Patiriisocius sp.]|jgi:hypothetical protein